MKDYGTRKPKTDPTFSPQWSGRTGAPKCQGGSCTRCSGPVHHEGDSHYCPGCDDYVSAVNCSKRG